MCAVKLQGKDKGNCPLEQQQQLSACLPIHVFMVHQPLDEKLALKMSALSDLGKVVLEKHQLIFENASYSCLLWACG